MLHFVIPQKSTHGSESKESTPASPEFASGKWLPGRLGNVIIVMTQEDYSEVCQVLKEKDVDHQVYKEVCMIFCNQNMHMWHEKR